MKKLIILTCLLTVAGFAFGQSSKAQPTSQPQKIVTLEKSDELKSNSSTQKTSEIKSVTEAPKSNTKANSTAKLLGTPKLYLSIEDMLEAERKAKENEKINKPN